MRLRLREGLRRRGANARVLACLLLPTMLAAAAGEPPAAPAAPAAAPEAGAVLPAASTDPRTQVDEAVRAAQRMKSAPTLRALLPRVRAVFIVPRFDARATTVGGKGAEGVLLARQGDKWSHPLFYDTGPVGLGAHAGAGIGAFAALLLSEQAVKRFVRGDGFQLSMDAGFNIADRAADAGPFPAEGDDVVMWSDVAGLFSGAAVSIDGIATDARDNRAYYGRMATVQEILSGEARNAHADPLRDILAP